MAESCYLKDKNEAKESKLGTETREGVRKTSENSKKTMLSVIIMEKQVI